GAIIDADLAPRRAETFRSASVDWVARGARPDTPHPDTDQIGRELENLGFELDWLADDCLHAHRDGIATAVWRSYTTLTGKSAASAAQHPRVAHGLLTRAGLPTP